MIYPFGDNHLPQSKNLNIIKKILLIQKSLKKAGINIDTMILHLACISNDPTYELDPKLSKNKL